MKKIAVIGEILVEIMADHRGDGFLEPIALTGPYPSGAPAIYIDQVAKLGHPGAIISAVGNDDFGRVNLERLEQDGVDISAVSIDPDRPTGSAFVRYCPDGSRNFVFNIKHSACGQMSVSDASMRALETVDHVHVMGSSLLSAEFVALNLRAAKAVKDRGGTVSFDPNLRKEILDSPGMREAMGEILALTDLFLPSGEEIFLLTQAKKTDGAVQELLGLGVRVVVHKLGSEGVRFFDEYGSRFVRAFQVEEIDPTGAGDCFGGAFTALWLRGGDIDETLTLAAAAGALAVTRRGPMEGTSDLESLKRFVETNPAHEIV
ncbi:MAG: sugar kinase [Rhodospirillales bacterium]|nr:sugar kinase [Rhodospirillales bacterium]